MKMIPPLLTIAVVFFAVYAHSEDGTIGNIANDATLQFRLPTDMQANPLPLWLQSAKELYPSIDNIPTTPDVLLLLLKWPQVLFVVRRDPISPTILLVRCLRLDPFPGEPRALAWCQRSLEHFAHHRH